MLKISTERVINILLVIGKYPVTMETLALACCVLCPSLNILLLLWLLKWALPRGEKNEGLLTTESRIKPVMKCVNFWLQWTMQQMVYTLPHHACMISFKTSSGPDGPAKSQYKPTYLYMYHCLSEIYTILLIHRLLECTDSLPQVSLWCLWAPCRGWCTPVTGASCPTPGRP